MDSLNRAENSLLELLLNGKGLLIISGEVNSGKTLTIEKLILLLQSTGKKVGGVYSKGIFRENIKIGFNIIDIKSGKVKHIASIAPQDNFILNQGRYYFDPDIFYEYNNKLINSLDADVIFIDEIGYLELKGKGFYPSVKNLLEYFSGKLVFVIRSIVLDEVLNKFNLDRKNIFVLEENWLDNF